MSLKLVDDDQQKSSKSDEIDEFFEKNKIKNELEENLIENLILLVNTILGGDWK